MLLWFPGKLMASWMAHFFSSEVALRLVCLWSSFHSPLFTGTTDILIPGSYFSNKSESLGGVVLKVWAELKIPPLLQNIRQDVLHMVGNNNSVILASIYIYRYIYFKSSETTLITWHHKVARTFMHCCHWWPHFLNTKSLHKPVQGHTAMFKESVTFIHQLQQFLINGLTNHSLIQHGLASCSLEPDVLGWTDNCLRTHNTKNRKTDLINKYHSYEQNYSFITIEVLVILLVLILVVATDLRTLLFHLSWVVCV